MDIKCKCSVCEKEFECSEIVEIKIHQNGELASLCVDCAIDALKYLKRLESTEVNHPVR